MWLDGELLALGPSVRGEVVRWETSWPGRGGDSVDLSACVLVVPALDDAADFGQSTRNNPRYAALITGTGPHEWDGSGPTGPVVCLDVDLFRTGDRVCVEGTTGRVELLDVEEVPVVTSFLEAPDGRILLLRRSSRVGTFQGRWAGVSGFLEAETPEAQAYTEIREETGLAPEVLHLERAGRTVYARDGGRIFSIHPFRFRTQVLEVRLDWEHTEAEWVDPAELSRRDIVPKLDRVWAAVRPDGNA